MKPHPSESVFSFVSGAWRILSLSDGYVDMSCELLKEPDGRAHYGPEGPPLRLSVNCFLIERDGAERILIDCGAGGSWDPTMGHLEAALAKAGVDPLSITTVAFTHAHADHVNGLITPDGRAAFPRLSRIVIAEGAVEGFRERELLARFRPLLTPIESGARLGEMVAVALPGHAPGHTGFVLDTGDARILFCGDLVHIPAAQFERPELTWGYDDDQSVARATRLQLLEEAARAGLWLAGAHLGRPGIGRVVARASGYGFEPMQ